MCVCVCVKGGGGCSSKVKVLGKVLESKVCMCVFICSLTMNVKVRWPCVLISFNRFREYIVLYRYISGPVKFTLR